ncbi:MAG TPA: benzoate-CoA ligase family protein [Steroidobacteraceae bacterium]|nr:benzoate-CoA ligase family protein [Steroidobacteraceae bacterium]
MPGLSSADHRTSPPLIDIPVRYNAAYDLLQRNLAAGRGPRTAYVDDLGRYTYAELAERVNRCSGALRTLGIQPGERVLLSLTDTIDFPTAFLGCIQAGIVPVAVNTGLRQADYEFLLRDSGACGAIVSTAVAPRFTASRPLHLIVSDAGPSPAGATDSSTTGLGGSEASGPGDPTHGGAASAAPERLSFAALLRSAPTQFEAADTARDDACFWLYSSGSTGKPKGTIHAHSSLIQTAELYARPILGLGEQDVVFSAPKLFFAYGLGNALSFPLAVGATAILMAERPTPDAVYSRLRQHRPTVFSGVPTLYAAMLAGKLPAPAELNLRLCVSAGEALPKDIGERWHRHFGVDILDGIGSTEMLHIFLSNRPGAVCYGTTGAAVPGYRLRLLDEAGQPVPAGQIGELQISGPSCALGYWNSPEQSRETFHGPWARSGDKFHVDANGRYVYAGRSDDMLKVSGMYVSPAEVESALISHPAVLEAAVIGAEDVDGLIKPLACVVTRAASADAAALVATRSMAAGAGPVAAGSAAAGDTAPPTGRAAAATQLAEELKQHVKSVLAPHKYPRWIEFLPELPRTATGKIQRFRLREQFARRPLTR